MKALLWLRFRYLLAGYSRTLTGHGKKTGKLTPVLLGLLLLYAFGVLLAGVVYFCAQLTIFAQLGLSWLYFLLVFLAGGALAIFGSVYATQSQLYQARDNELLLAMPIRMEQLCLSRVLFLLLGTFGWVGFIAVPAFVVYWIFCGMSPGLFVGFLVTLVAMTFLCQTISCLLGWLLHLLLARIRNKAVGSLLFMVLFLAVYFPAYFGILGRFEDILGSLQSIGGELAVLFDGIGGPLIWLGRGAMGEVLPLLWMGIITAAVTAGGYFFLIATYRASLLRPVAVSGGRKGKAATAAKAAPPMMAICKKELRRLLTCPVYLTNSGIGLVMLLFAGAGGVIFRDKVLEAFAPLPAELRTLFLPGALVAVMSFLLSTVWLTAPSVSLEGKSLWIPASLPIPGRTIVRGKLLLHTLAAVPFSMVVALALGLAYGLPFPVVLCGVLFGGFSAQLSGQVGLLFNLRFPRFDWLSEVYPCKQAVAILFTMLTMLGVTVLCCGGYVLVCLVTRSALLGILTATALSALLCLITWLTLERWGARRMEELLTDL